MRSDTMSPDLSWIIELLWGRSEGLSISTQAPPAGYRETENFAVIPNASRPRFLVPLRSRRLAWATLASYNALRPPARRLARAVIGMGLRTGVAQQIFRDRVRIAVAEEDPPAGAPEPLTDYLQRAFGGQEIATAIGVKGPDPFRKPVLHVFDLDGRPMGYVKIGWNEFTRSAVRAEARVLSAWSARRPHTIRVPTLIHHGQWQDLEVTISSPLPSGVRRYRPSEGLPPLRATREVAELDGLVESPLADSLYWKKVRNRMLGRRESGPVTDILRRLVERLEGRFGDLPLTFGAWHGDWVPWNFAWLGSSLFVWDWEDGGAQVPLGFDVLHFHFQLGFVWKRKNLGDAVAIMRTRALRSLTDLGVPEQGLSALPSMYLLELFFRYHQAQATGAGRNPRFHPDILQILHTEEERLR